MSLAESGQHYNWERGGCLDAIVSKLSNGTLAVETRLLTPEEHLILMQLGMRPLGPDAPEPMQTTFRIVITGNNK